jgi:carbamoyl-phosphate synthase large subunit
MKFTHFLKRQKIIIRGNNELPETLTILITGAGSPGAPGVIKSLRSVKDNKLKLIGIDIISDVASKAMLDKFFVGPKALDPNFIEECLNLCTTENIDVILPMVSLELPKFSKHRQQFKNIGTEVSVSDSQPLLQAMNKGTLIQRLKETGILFLDPLQCIMWMKCDKPYIDWDTPGNPFA